MRKHVATTLGLLIAPLIAALSLVAIAVAKNGLHLLDESTLGWALIFYCYTLGVTLIIGLPAYLLLNRYGKVTWWSAILVGLLSGAAMVFILDYYYFLVVPIGGLSAFVFWLIWTRGHEVKPSDHLTFKE